MYSFTYWKVERQTEVFSLLVNSPDATTAGTEPSQSQHPGAVLPLLHGLQSPKYRHVNGKLSQKHNREPFEMGCCCLKWQLSIPHHCIVHTACLCLEIQKAFIIHSRVRNSKINSILLHWENSQIWNVICVVAHFKISKIYFEENLLSYRGAKTLAYAYMVMVTFERRFCV